MICKGGFLWNFVFWPSGDVVGDGGLQCLEQHLRSLKKLYRIDFCVVNGENASGTGLTPKQADRMLDAGADILTLGNHSFDRREICAYLDDCPYILRPANLHPSLPGRGFGVFETKIGQVGVVNLLGRCNLDFRPDNPFRVIDKVLKELDGLPVLLDFHAEATSEKLAMAYYLDGKISASGARTRTCRPPTSRSCRRAPGISLTSA